jgi:hypothetical protein
LCLALGVEHPNKLDLTAWEFTEWLAYFETTPFGEDVGHLMSARMIAAWGGKNERLYMPTVHEPVDQDFAAAEGYLQELIRHGDC